MKYIVVGCKPWSKVVFDEVISKYNGTWCYISIREQLNIEYVCTLNPEYIFFLHWSWRVPDEIVEKYQCVCFHMTDLPFGRGGSPLQNLIIRGHQSTKLTAFKMTGELDAGEVYLKEDLFIGDGTAEEIYNEASYLAADMIHRIINEHIIPVPQQGDPTVFKRRCPSESRIDGTKSDLRGLYDFIRMLDATGYPKAYLEIGSMQLEYSKARLCGDRIIAEVVIKERNK